MTDKEIMQKVLDALDLLAWCENPATRVQVRKPKGSGSIVTVYPHKVATDAAALLREWMAQPELKIVAWMYNRARYGPTDLRGQQWRPELSRLKPYEGNGMVRDVTPLYTSPPRREPLTPQSPCEMTQAEYKIFKLGWLECESAHGIRGKT